MSVRSVTSESLCSSNVRTSSYKQVLVVDDQLMNVEVLQSMLDLEGMASDTALNGTTALQRV